MRNNRDDYEPIIAERRSREPVREDAPPLWRLVLTLGAGLAVAVLLAWWLMRGSSSEETSAIAQPESTAPEIRVEQEPAPPARNIETSPDVAQAPVVPADDAEPAAPTEPAPDAGQGAMPESTPEVAADNAAQESAPATQVPVRFTSPDSQVRIELLGPLDSSPPVTSNAGDVVTLAPGKYRMIASGAQLETFEQEITFDGERPLEYTVELCAERKQERGNLAGKIVEERACASTAQCESMFMVLSEYADELVKDRAFRTQECAKWRADAAPDGRWTLDAKCGGETLATTCRIEIAEGACTFAEAPRSVRGTQCPRVELK